MNKKNLLYIAAVLVLLLFPLVGMPLFGSEWSTETTELAPAPQLKTEEGKLNTSYIADAGNWFQDHFALRSDLITANSLLQDKVFGTSASRKITVGQDDWLYFNGDMDDYQSKNRMSERELYNIAHNLNMICQYYNLLGKKVVFTISPNKTTLYPENLPFNIVKGEETGNVERLIPYLEDLEIPYVDLFSLFREQDECLYFKQDSHWNNKGAALVYNALMEAAGYTDYETYEDAEPSMEAVHSGDLAEMLYPEKVVPEADYTYPIEGTWEYVESEEHPLEEEKNMSSYIQTVNPEGNGKLYMFRDSFGASLVPFFAQAFEEATFSWLVPYNLSDVVLQGADTVIIELVERNIDFLAEYGASLPAYPAFGVQLDPDLPDNEKIQTPQVIGYHSGPYFELKGVLRGNVPYDTDLLIRISTEDGTELGVYTPFYKSTADDDGTRLDDYEYMLDLLSDELPGKLIVEVYAKNENSLSRIGSSVLDTAEDITAFG